jgi:hypothetical protein
MMEFILMKIVLIINYCLEELSRTELFENLKISSNTEHLTVGQDFAPLPVMLKCYLNIGSSEFQILNAFLLSVN